VALIVKPFTQSGLAQKIRQVFASSG